jgi:hypothetical protein
MNNEIARNRRTWEGRGYYICPNPRHKQKVPLQSVDGAYDVQWCSWCGFTVDEWWPNERVIWIPIMRGQEAIEGEFTILFEPRGEKYEVKVEGPKRPDTPTPALDKYLVERAEKEN